MAILVSPGVNISVIDQSISQGAGPGTVPLVIIATQANKSDPTTTGVTAPGTLAANAGKVYSITSQRDLIQTFGDPVFYSVSGTSLNGYPLNEYGLLAAYSYLGIANLARVVRADVDLAQLEPSAIAPTSPAAVGTLWLDESSSGTAYGLFTRTGTFPNETWAPITPNFVYNYTTVAGLTAVPPVGDGVNGNIAVQFKTLSGQVEYYVKISGTWTLFNANTTTAGVIVSSVWPDLTNPSTTQFYWIKTTSAAQGANFVLRKMDATTLSFVQEVTPILTNDAAADTYYSTLATGSAGQFYIEPVIIGSAPGGINGFQFRTSTVASGSWSTVTSIIGLATAPVGSPAVGQLWFNPLLGLTSSGQSTIDILVNDGTDNWKNINLPGFTGLGTLPTVG